MESPAMLSQRPDEAAGAHHADERGSEYNLGLGDARATAAKNYQVQVGIPAGQLKTGIQFLGLGFRFATDGWIRLPANLKAIHAQKLYRAEVGHADPGLT